MRLLLVDAGLLFWYIRDAIFLQALWELRHQLTLPDALRVQRVLPRVYFRQSDASIAFKSRGWIIQSAGSIGDTVLTYQLWLATYLFLVLKSAMAKIFRVEREIGIGLLMAHRVLLILPEHGRWFIMQFWVNWWVRLASVIEWRHLGWVLFGLSVAQFVKKLVPGSRVYFLAL